VVDQDHPLGVLPSNADFPVSSFLEVNPPSKPEVSIEEPLHGKVTRHRTCSNTQPRPETVVDESEEDEVPPDD
jgi:hypothetical protein